MKRLFRDDSHEPPAPHRRRKKRVRLLPFLLMIIGAATVFVMAARYVIVPLLVWAGGQVG